MSYDGNGVYNLPQPAYPAIPNTVIESAKYNEVLEDLQGALSIAWPRDGQAAATGHMPLGGFKLTGVANGTNPQDATTVLQVFTDPTFTGTTATGVVIQGTKLTVTAANVELPANTSIGPVSAAELGLLAGLTENVQNGLDSKANLVGGNVFSGLQVLWADLLDGSTGVTQAPSDSSNKVATTQFVQQVSMNSALPHQAGNAVKFLTTDGINAFWQYNSPDLPLLALGIY